MSKQSTFLIIEVSGTGLKREINCFLNPDGGSAPPVRIHSITRTSAFDNQGKATYLVITESIS